MEQPTFLSCLLSVCQHSRASLANMSISDRGRRREGIAKAVSQRSWAHWIAGQVLRLKLTCLSLIYWRCQKGVDLSRIRPTQDRCHARDLSAVVDLVRHGCMEVRIFRKQRVEVGHHAVLINEGMGPVEVGVPGASHHLALVVDARGYCASLRGIESRIGSQLHESLLSDN